MEGTVMSKRLIYIIISTILLVENGIAMANDIYIAQTAVGVADGSSCSNAYAVTFFNTAGNWGAGANTIGAGTTVHLCGTITTNLVVNGSGSVGSPITIFFETGANVSPSLCGANGCINVEGKSNITIDGGIMCGYVNRTDVACNGTVKNTTVIPASSSFGINATACENCEIRNLQIGPIIQPSGNNQGSGDFRGVQNLGGTRNGSTFKIHNNKITYVASAVAYVPTANDDGFQMYNNTTDNINSSIDISNNNNGTMTKALIYNNHFGGTAIWDATGCPQHHNSLHAFAKIGANGGTNSGIDYYNNLVDGYWGVCATGELFIEGGEYGSNRNIRVWNNLFLATYDQMNNGIVSLNGDGDLAFYNNTIIGGLKSGDVCFSGGGNGSNTINFNNNIISGCNTLVFYKNIILGNWDYNLYGGNNSNPWTKQTAPAAWYNTLGSWQSATGRDTYSTFNSSISYVKVNTDGTLQSSSPAIKKGNNLTFLGISTLNVDIAGNARPSTGPWDIGAFKSLFLIPLPPDIISVH